MTMAMTNKFFLFLIVFAFSLSLAQQAVAQRCETDYELIFKISKPEIGSYNVWDTIYGEREPDERFKSGLTLENSHVVVAGERFKFEDGDKELVIAEMERRGRVLWEQFHTVEHLRGVVKILRHKNGYMVVADKQDQERAWIWFGFFDKQGFLTGERDLRNRNGKLSAQDIVKAGDKPGYMMVAALEPKKAAQHALFYHISEQGGSISDFAFMPGLNNQINSLQSDSEGSYLAAGYIRGEDGRKNGWMLKLDAEGTIVWQQQYPRGRAGHLARAVPFSKEYVMAAGQAVPAGPGRRAGWVMLLSASNGNVVWQRYYTDDDLDNEANDLLARDDGLVSVMLQAKKVNDDGQEMDFVRLLTLNPRGVLFISDEYFNGKGSRGYQLIESPGGERIIIGDTDVEYIIENDDPEKEPETELSLNGWVLAATAMEAYADPCIQPYQFLP